jgi:hypothetical protein
LTILTKMDEMSNDGGVRLGGGPPYALITPP